MKFYNTYNSQFELLPRITVIYGRHIEFSRNGIALEWLWFGVYLKFRDNSSK